MQDENIQPRKMVAGQWFWLEKAIIRKYLSRIGASGFAVYSFLASCVDEKQTCFPSQGYIAAGLKCSRATVNRAIQKLEAMRFITRSIGSGGRRKYHLSAISVESAVDKKDEGCMDATDLSHLCTGAVAPVDTNNKQIRRMNNNNWERENLLASILADSLDNQEALPVYQSYARRYPESVLRKVLTETKEMPANKIRKSRSHLFTYLLKRHV